MTRYITLTVLTISILGLTATAQQNVTIKPGDDVLAILDTVVDPGSTITFEPGYYLVTRRADGSGPNDLLRPPPGTTIRGAGSGFDPATATILDCGYTFDSAIKIDDGIDGVTVEDLTITRTIDALIEIDAGSFDNTINNVWALKAMSSLVFNDGGDIALNYCVLGWSSGDVVFCDDVTVPSTTVLTNCDIFLGNSDIVESESGSELYLRNCILYAGNGSNDIQIDGGWIVVRASVGWDPFDGDPPGLYPGGMPLLGRLDLNGDPDVGDNCVGEDPMYVKPPGPVEGGVGYKADEMDLHLKEGSPALTAGSTSFDAEHNPTGDPTFAGSQGPAPVDVANWPIH